MATPFTLGGLAKSFREHICDARAEIYVNKTFKEESDSIVGRAKPRRFSVHAVAGVCSSFGRGLG